MKIKFLILLSIALVPIKSLAIYGFDECYDLESNLKYIYSDQGTSRDLSRYEDIGIYLHMAPSDDQGQIIVRNKRNNIYFGSMSPMYYLKYEIEPGYEIIKINNAPVSELKDNEIFEISKGDSILVNYKDFDGKEYTKQIEYLNPMIIPVGINFEIKDINSINSAKSEFSSSYTSKISIDNYDVNNAAKRTILNIINYLNESSPDLEYKTIEFSCKYDEESFKNLNISFPNININNLTSFSDGLSDMYYAIDVSHIIGNETFDPIVKIVQIRNEIGIFKSKFNYQSFPFDSQKLFFEFVSQESLPTGFIAPFFNNQKYLFKSIEELNISEWNIKDQKIVPYLYTDSLEYIHLGQKIEIKIDRNFSYYIYKIILPIIFILFVSISILWIRVEELEARLTVGVVCFLALITYTYIIDEDLPKLSYLTIMDNLILLSYFFATISTLQSIYVNNLIKTNYEKGLLFNNKSKKIIPVFYFIAFTTVIFYTALTQENTVSALRIIS